MVCFSVMKGLKMNVNGVSALLNRPQNQTAVNKLTKVNVTQEIILPAQSNLPCGQTFLAQMPNVSFGNSAGFNYGHDDLSRYDEYIGPPPPEDEVTKLKLSKQAVTAIEKQDYLSAIDLKIQVAGICKKQGLERDAFILEEGIRRLYRDLPLYLREQAKGLIGKYNQDMAKYIEADIKKLVAAVI